jgi:hypothetical protein
MKKESKNYTTIECLNKEKINHREGKQITMINNSIKITTWKDNKKANNKRFKKIEDKITI